MKEEFLNLIRYIINDNQKMIRLQAIELLENDKTKTGIRNHSYLIQELKNIITKSNFTELPSDMTGLLTVEDVSNFREDRYFLTENELKCYNKIYNIKKKTDELKTIGIKYLNATLLYGESGVGKTTFGRYVAYKLGLPFIYINFSNFISSYLGKTGANIDKTFKYIKGKPCVLMLDELDVIASVRGSGDVGEISRITISLMQSIDSLDNDSIVISATNRLDIIDTAILRRFPTQHNILPLSDINIKKFIDMFVKTLPENMVSKIDCDEICKSNLGGKQSNIINSIIEQIISGN